jgi:hypothetical protein
MREMHQLLSSAGRPTTQRTSLAQPSTAAADAVHESLTQQLASEAGSSVFAGSKNFPNIRQLNGVPGVVGSLFPHVAGCNIMWKNKAAQDSGMD